MLSRIAEALYWMARNLERADGTARILDINVLHMLEANDGATEEGQWRPLLDIVDAHEAYGERYPDGAIGRERVIHFLTQGRDNPSSLHSCVRLARENARVVRDRISNEMWEAINQLWLEIDKHLHSALEPRLAADLYAYVHNEVAMVLGLTQGTMMRGEAHAFSVLGGLQERADMTARILDVRYHLLLPDLSLVGSPLDYYQWGALLKSLSGFEAYRRDHQAGIRPIDVVAFVVLNPDFPRSLAFCVERIDRALARIGLVADGTVGDRMQSLRSHLAAVTPQGILDEGLHQYLERFLERLADLTEALQRDYFEAHLGYE